MRRRELLGLRDRPGGTAPAARRGRGGDGQFDLLRVLAERPNRVLSRDTLVDLLKGYYRDPFDRSIDIRVTRLRKKIEADPAAPAYIRTVRGEGYLFNPLGTQS
jgi:two-component system phosphate regulon response regulator OmpR